MDKNLSWKYHVEHVLSKISKTVGMISNLRHFVPKQIHHLLYPCQYLVSIHLLIVKEQFLCH